MVLLPIYLPILVMNQTSQHRTSLRSCKMSLNWRLLFCWSWNFTANISKSSNSYSTVTAILAFLSNTIKEVFIYLAKEDKDSMYILGFLAAGSHCIPRFWARLCASSCAMGKGRPYCIPRAAQLFKKKKKKLVIAMNTTLGHSGWPHTYYYNNSVQSIRILCAYKENKLNKVHNR